MEWYYAQDKQQKGPVNDEQFAELVRTGIVRADTLVWKAGMTAWQPYGQVLSAVAQPTAPSVTPPVAQAAAPAAFSSTNLASGENQRYRALSKVKAPAVCLMVYAVIVGGCFLWGVADILRGSEYVPLPGMSPEAVEIAKKVYGPSQKISTFMNFIAAIVIAIGSWRMMSLKNYGLCVAASILAFLPCSCPCCFLGIGFGVWALVVLNNSEVKEQFS